MCIVWNRSNGLGHVVLRADCPRLSWPSRLSLQMHMDTLLLRLALLNSVLLHSADELLARARVLDVLDAGVNALLHVSVVDTLVDDDTDSGLGNVVDNTGFTVVDLVGHTVKMFSTYIHPGDWAIEVESLNVSCDAERIELKRGLLTHVGRRH